MDIDYFAGKICTVLTQPVNAQFKDFVQHAQYFTGEVVAIDPVSVWVKHPQSKTLSCFNRDFIIGIIEEQYVAPSDPLMDKIKDDLKKKEVKPMPKPPSPHNPLPLQQLTKMVR